MSNRLVLASRSAVRVRLLRDAGLVFEADAADLDEDALVSEVADPKARALLLARQKAMWVSGRHPGAFVLGGDQVGVLDDGTFLEKPQDPEHHARMLLSMAGRTHRFVPAVALVKDGVLLGEASDEVSVKFRAFGPMVAHAYASSGEGQGSCGGYESEHRGAQLMAAVEGDLHAVVGFPLLLALELLRKHDARTPGLLF